MSKVIHSGTQNFDADVLESQVPVFVDFWAEWCGPCRIIGPIIDDLAKEFDGKVKFVKVNVDENGEISDRYQIQAIPTLIVFKNGQQVNRIVGAAPKGKYQALVREVLGS
jgi:thioredoxin 1